MFIKVGYHFKPDLCDSWPNAVISEIKKLEKLPNSSETLLRSTALPYGPIFSIPTLLQSPAPPDCHQSVTCIVPGGAAVQGWWLWRVGCMVWSGWVLSAMRVGPSSKTCWMTQAGRTASGCKIPSSCSNPNSIIRTWVITKMVLNYFKVP